MPDKPPLAFLVPKAADGVIAYSAAGPLDLRLPFAAAKGSELTMYFSSFVGEQGDALAVEPSIVEQTGVQMAGQRLTFKMDREILTLRLKVSAPLRTGRYSGSISIIEGGKLVQTEHLALTSSPGGLVTDGKEITAYRKLSIRSDRDASQSAAFRIALRNTSAVPVHGIYLRVLEQTAPQGQNLDVGRNLKLSWNGKAADDLWRSPKGDARSIPPHQQVEIQGELSELPPGEYTMKIGFGAANAVIDPEQNVKLKLYVTDSVWRAVGVLLLAIFVSFIATKGVEVWRRRAALLKKIDELRSNWLSEEPAPLALVATRALLKQAQDRNRSWLKALLGPDVTTAQLERAEKLVKLLDHARRTRAQIDSSGWPIMERYRALKSLTAITGSLAGNAIDDATAEAIEKKLSALDEWLDPTRHKELYEAAFKGDIESLLKQALPASFPAPLLPQIEALHKALAPYQQGISPEVELAYAKLKILCERNRNGDMPGLDRMAGVAKAANNLAAFLHDADDFAWEELENAEIEFVAPGRSDIDPPHAFALIQFQIAPKERKRGDNYLFKHNTEYIWVLELERKLPFWSFFRCTEQLAQPKVLTTRRTNEPRLAQYAPSAGRLSVTVTRRFNGKEVAPIRTSMSIQRSSEYSWLTALRFTDLMALLIATVFALASGLGTYYFGKPSFGTPTDYISLFVWGAGVDQTKNFLQHLASSKT